MKGRSPHPSPEGFSAVVRPSALHTNRGDSPSFLKENHTDV
jgi:hypothetical protein